MNSITITRTRESREFSAVTRQTLEKYLIKAYAAIQNDLLYRKKSKLRLI